MMQNKEIAHNLSTIAQNVEAIRDALEALEEEIQEIRETMPDSKMWEYVEIDVERANMHFGEGVSFLRSVIRKVN